MSALSLDTNQATINSENCPINSRFPIPDLHSVKINTEQLLDQLGSLSTLSVETEEHGYMVPSTRVDASLSARLLFGVPRLITDIPSGDKDLCNVSCLSDEEIWTSDENNILELYDLDRNLNPNQIRDVPQGIAVTRSAITL